ncbi:unknown [Prevotella sp. CAG:520]|nr:unknown [Prevotella sp. CAG:520]
MINPHPFPLPPNAIRLDGERNLIGRRTQSNRTPNAIQSDTVRNPIGHRTEHDDFSCAFTERKRSCNPHMPNTYTGNASA